LTEDYIIISREKFEISKKLTKLKISGRYRLLPNAVKYMGDSFSNIKRITFEDFEIECVCIDLKKFVLIVMKILLKFTQELLPKTLFTVDLIHKNRHLKEIYNKIVISSVFDEYLIFQNTYRLIFKTNFSNFEKVGKFSLISGYL
jgi:hypothetical protein